MPDPTRGLLPLALVLAFLAGGASAGEGPAGRGVAVGELLPAAASLPGWIAVEGPVDYGPDTLFEYIDGAARMYHAFGFTRLAHVRYEPENGDGSSIVLDIYHMGDELGAYGIYTNTRPPEIEPLDWGAEGYRQDRVAAAWRGAIYVHAEAEGADPASAELLERLVAGVAAAAPGEPSLPRMARLLPREGFVRNSDRYVANDLLGHACLPGGMLAEYAVEEGEYLLFVSDAGAIPDARAAVETLRKYEREDGELLEQPSRLGDGGFRAIDPGLGRGIVVSKGRFVAGIWGGSSEAAARLILGALLTNLGPSPSDGSTPAPTRPSK